MAMSRSEYRKQYDKDHPEKLKARKKRYRETHKEQLSNEYREWRIKNQDRIKKRMTEYRRTLGMLPMNENKKCSSFLGIHVAERVLSKVFKNVVRMPYHNRGYDFLCSKQFKIEVKSGCQRIKTRSWSFTVKKNKIADYFLFLAFDNREDLNPVHIWRIPGKLINDKNVLVMSLSTMHQWDEYKLDIDGVASCCNAIKGVDANGL